MLLKFSTIAKNDHYSTQSVGKIDSIHCTSQFIINIGVVVGSHLLAMLVKRIRV